MGNLYKLQKFTSRDELIKCVSQEGGKEGEFDVIRGLTVHREQVYVCDRDNHRIQVFDLDLKFIRSVGSRGKERGKFTDPNDVKCDTAGNMYLADFQNNRVQVMDSSGQFIRVVDQEGEGKLYRPSALHFADKYVYVSDFCHYRIVVYETSGRFVTSLGREGHRERESLNIHPVSPLVLMGSFMCVITIEFRYCSLCFLFVYIIIYLMCTIHI